MSILGKLPLCVNQYPTGRWGFVGRVPADLAWTSLDGGPPDPAEVDVASQFGARFAKVRSRSWETREDALRAAAEIGAEVKS